MQLVLLEKVKNLGDLGDIVKVKPGYGRNFLVPRGKAVFATQENLAVFEEKKAELEKRAAENLSGAQKRVQELAGLEVVTIAAHASDEGKLYGSVGAREIADAITSQGVEVAKAEVLLPNGPIRVTGEHEVELSLHSDVRTNVKLTVVAE